jgi:oligopeptidase B
MSRMGLVIGGGLMMALLGTGGSGCSGVAPVPEPPVAKVVPREFEEFGHTRVDNYYWLRERENPEVTAYLEAENAYTKAVMAPTEAFQEKLFEEIKGRIKQTDLSVPYRFDDYFYYEREEEGKEYPIYCRKRGSLDAAEEIMLDVNQMAEGHEFFAVAGREISINQDILAYAVDTVGRRIYSIEFKNLATGEILPDRIDSVTGNMAWANDNRTLFYTKQDPVTLRWDRVYRHELGTDPTRDALVYEEADEEFYTYIYRTKSKRFLVIHSEQTLSSEARILEADSPAGDFRVFEPRARDHEYRIEHFGDHFYIRTNSEAKNFRLMRTPVKRTAKKHWEEVIGHREDVLIESAEMFNDFLVIQERKDGLIQLRIRPWSGGEEHYVDFGEPAYLAYTSDNFVFDTPVLRFVYTSMATPRSVYDYDMSTRQRTLLKQDEVLGDFDPDHYATERVYAVARDGGRVPVSLLYRKGLPKDGSNPLYLYGYGSYGYSMDASFSSIRLSLVDRGFIYAIAHVRGGEEMGRRWYEDGKLLKKKNTFTDFVDCAEYLVAQGYTRNDLLFGYGGSAGGLLVGAVANMRPDLFHALIADVPFVDVITTMLDESIPLTTYEYDEWGNPNDSVYYEYMLSYSPYDNVEAKEYPNLLVMTGLHDSQVQYWEPAKWVAKLRALKTDSNRLLLKTEMEAGHGGASGRYKPYKEYAFMSAYVLDLLGQAR